jgi:hypothetical protein
MYYTIQNQSLNVEIFRAQLCLLEWSPGRPNLIFGDQNLNLVASVIEVGDRKFWIIFHHWFDFSDWRSFFCLKVRWNRSNINIKSILIFINVPCAYVNMWKCPRSWNYQIFYKKKMVIMMMLSQEQVSNQNYAATRFKFWSPKIKFGRPGDHSSRQNWALNISTFKLWFWIV